MGKMDSIVHPSDHRDTVSPTLGSDKTGDARLRLIQRYLLLTRQVMPAMARAEKTGWPVRNDHCFQRIVLDTICGGIWYDAIARPAYKSLTLEQADHAVRLCEQIIAGCTDLAELNRKSLAWRGKL